MVEVSLSIKYVLHMDTWSKLEYQCFIGF